MNFLSHFYFDRKNPDAYEVLGVIMPDLIKNANKNWNPHPEKNEHLFKDNIAHNALFTGWKRHLKVDRIFHNSDFFLLHQHQIKLQLKDILVGSPVKPFFLGHISLELMLDSLLITENKIDVHSLYEYLNKIDQSELESFIRLNNITDVDQFFHFFEIFKKEKYLFSYAEPSKISYALKRICMRIWENPFTIAQEDAITQCLIKYKNSLSDEFIFIFDEIDAAIN